jgi:hypothetical protein
MIINNKNDHQIMIRCSLLLRRLRRYIIDGAARAAYSLLLRYFHHTHNNYSLASGEFILIRLWPAEGIVKQVLI